MAHQDPTWTVIPDFEGHQVNAQGEIRAIATGKLLSGSVNQTGVRYVTIRNTSLSQYQNPAVSVLVADTFCHGRSPQNNTVLHLNGDTEDNRAENLMWASRFHTIQYHQEINNTDPKTLKRRIQDVTIDPRTQGRFGPIYRNIIEAAKATGCIPSNIDYAARYNAELGSSEHMNMLHRVWPGPHLFVEA